MSLAPRSCTSCEYASELGRAVHPGNAGVLSLLLINHILQQLLQATSCLRNTEKCHYTQVLELPSSACHSDCSTIATCLPLRSVKTGGLSFSCQHLRATAVC